VYLVSLSIDAGLAGQFACGRLSPFSYSLLVLLFESITDCRLVSYSSIRSALVLAGLTGVFSESFD
jgi:hypothetical protein